MLILIISTICQNSSPVKIGQANAQTAGPNLAGLRLADL